MQPTAGGDPELQLKLHYTTTCEVPLRHYIKAARAPKRRRGRKQRDRPDEKKRGKKPCYH
jgi:hypothetical protein